jgi:hypothetical protein
MWMIICFTDILPTLFLATVLGAGTAVVLSRSNLYKAVLPSVIGNGFYILYVHFTCPALPQSSWYIALLSAKLFTSILVSSIAAWLVLPERRTY